MQLQLDKKFDAVFPISLQSLRRELTVQYPYHIILTQQSFPIAYSRAQVTDDLFLVMTHCVSVVKSILTGPRLVRYWLNKAVELNLRGFQTFAHKTSRVLSLARWIERKKGLSNIIIQSPHPEYYLMELHTCQK